MDKVDGLTNEVRLHNATMNLRGALDHCNDHALKKVLMDELIRKCGLPAYALPTTYAHLSCPSSEKQSGKTASFGEFGTPSPVGRQSVAADGDQAKDNGAEGDDDPYGSNDL